MPGRTGVGPSPPGRQNGGVTNVHIVYAHPSPRSFTRAILDAFLGGLDEAGHRSTVSDLYAEGFRPELTLDEYERESQQRADLPVPADVAAEHERLNHADAWAFVYPLWWSDCPALLKGWFDRVWTVGYAYKPMSLRVASRALVLCTSGYGVGELESLGVYQATRTAMLVDRIGARARSSELVIFGDAVLRDAKEDRQRWRLVRETHLARAADLGRTIGDPQ